MDTLSRLIHPLRSSRPKRSTLGAFVLCFLLISSPPQGLMFTDAEGNAARANDNSLCGGFVHQSTLESAGRGVFSKERYEVGDVVERCMTLLVPDKVQLNTVLNNYVWYYDDEHSVISLGYCMLYNHSPKQNLEPTWLPPLVYPQKSVEEKKAFFEGYSHDSSYNNNLLGDEISLPINFPVPYSTHGDVVFRAMKEIVPGEEIFVSYGDEWFSTRDMHSALPDGTSGTAKRCKEGMKTRMKGICTPREQLPPACPAVTVKPSRIPGAGRGVFTTREYKKGTLVEISPTHTLPYHRLDNSILINYVMKPQDSEIAVLPMGSAPFYNHDSKNPALKYQWFDNVNKTEQEVPSSFDFLAFTAKRDIKIGDELTFDYGSGWEKAYKEYLLNVKGFLNGIGAEKDNIDVGELPLFRSFAEPSSAYIKSWPTDAEGLHDDEEEDHDEGGTSKEDDQIIDAKLVPWNEYACSLVLDRSTLPEAGRGVFAAKDFQKGDMAELCPTIMIPARVSSDSTINNYVWAGDDEDHSRLSMGLCMMFNHAPDHSLNNYWIDEDTPQEFVAKFNDDIFAGMGTRELKVDIAKFPLPYSRDGDLAFIINRDAKKGDELFVSYGAEWFDSRGVAEKEPDKNSNGSNPDNTNGVSAECAELLDQVEKELCVSAKSSSKEDTKRQFSSGIRRRNPINCPSGRVLPSNIPGAGRGTFTTRRFKKGEIVEIASTHLLPYQHVENSILENYVYRKRGSRVVILTTGYGAYYNHNGQDSNLRFHWYDIDRDDVESSYDIKRILPDDQPHKKFEFVAFVATRDINIGEELTIDYGTEWELSWTAYKDDTFALLTQQMSTDYAQIKRFYHAISAPESLAAWPSTAVGLDVEVRNEDDSHIKSLLQCGAFVAKSSFPDPGRGMFANASYGRGHPVEHCPALSIPPEAYLENVLHDYVMGANDEDGSAFLLLGRCTFAAGAENLSTANAQYIWRSVNPELNAMVLVDGSELPNWVTTRPYIADSDISFRTIKPVKEGQEIFVNYGAEWFKTRGISPAIPDDDKRTKDRLLWCPDVVIYKSDIRGAGRGVYANRDFSRGEIVEVVATWAIPRAHALKSSLENYVLAKEGSEDVAFVPAGYGGLYNHDGLTPNIRLAWYNPHTRKYLTSQDELQKIYDAGERLYLAYVAAVDIGDGEELTLRYGAGWGLAYKEYIAALTKEIRAIEKDAEKGGLREEDSVAVGYLERLPHFFHAIYVPDDLFWPTGIPKQASLHKQGASAIVDGNMGHQAGQGQCDINEDGSSAQCSASTQP